MTRHLRAIGRRALQSGALALALMALLTSLVHMGAVRHERCAEHGELVERTGHAPQAPRAPASPHELTQDALVAREGEADDHDHCPLATTSALPTQPDVLESATDVAAPCMRAAPAVVLVVTRDVLALAPKTSPPALA